MGEVLAAVDEQQVGVRCLQEGAALGGQDPDLVAQQPQPGQHLGGGLECVGQQQQGAQEVSSLRRGRTEAQHWAPVSENFR